MATRALKRHTIEHRRRSVTTPERPASSLDAAVKVEPTASDKLVRSATSSPASAATHSSSSSSKPTTVSPIYVDVKPSPLTLDVVDLTAASSADDAGEDSEIFQTKWRHGGAVGQATSISRGFQQQQQLRPNSARTAEVIKARYIRSAQQYRKICSLIELLAAQHGKLDARRRQLQRAMRALSTMYRYNKLRSTTAGSNNTTTTASSSSSHPASATSSLLTTTTAMTYASRQHLLSEVDYRKSSLLTQQATALERITVVDADEYPAEVVGCCDDGVEFGYNESGAAEMAQTAEDLCTARWYVIDDMVDDSSTAVISTTAADFRGDDDQRRHSYSPATHRALMTSSVIGRRTWSDDDGEEYDDRRGGYSNSRALGHLPPSRGDCGTVTGVAATAHSKSNCIDIDIADYERPVAAHTRKADWSSYSYMQLGRRQQPVDI